MGANGAGKSQLLREIVNNGGARNDVVFIEGGRSIRLGDSIQMLDGDVPNFESAVSMYNQQRRSDLSNRLTHSLRLLDMKGLRLRAQHSDAIEEWRADGYHGPVPARPQLPLDRVFSLFSELFPDIQLRADERRLWVKKDGHDYGPSSLSDGEKQSFSILADLIETTNTHHTVIVDEPELNLHPGIADRLWTLVEDEFPDHRFIYATHSINFALRENVEKVYVLGRSGRIEPFADLNALDRSEARELLGELPGMLSANRVVVTEGDDKSFDTVFYRWLINDPKVEIYAAGDCWKVSKVVEGSSVWGRISTGVSLLGVVDRDFRPEELISELTRAGSLVALELHEAESYACLPHVLSAIAKKIGSQAKLLEVKEVSDAIFAELRAQLHNIAAKRYFAKANLRLAVSVSRKILDKAAALDELIGVVRQECEIEAAKAHMRFDPDDAEQFIRDEVSRLNTIVTAGNVVEALKYLPGKELLNKLAPRAGCANATDVMRSLRANFKPADFSETAALASKLTRESAAPWP